MVPVAAARRRAAARSSAVASGAPSAENSTSPASSAARCAADPGRHLQDQQRAVLVAGSWRAHANASEGDTEPRRHRGGAAMSLYKLSYLADAMATPSPYHATTR
jgi:hypothetical protein